MMDSNALAAAANLVTTMTDIGEGAWVIGQTPLLQASIALLVINSVVLLVQVPKRRRSRASALAHPPRACSARRSRALPSRARPSTSRRMGRTTLMLRRRLADNLRSVDSAPRLAGLPPFHQELKVRHAQAAPRPTAGATRQPASAHMAAPDLQAQRFARTTGGVSGQGPGTVPPCGPLTERASRLRCSLRRLSRRRLALREMPVLRASLLTDPG